jgi:hypothetical protein
MATHIMGRIRETHTNIGTLPLNGIPIRRPILIGYPMSDGVNRRGRPAGVGAAEV